MITDQIKRNLPLEMWELFIGDLPKVKNINGSVNKLDSTKQDAMLKQ